MLQPLCISCPVCWHSSTPHICLHYSVSSRAYYKLGVSGFHARSHPLEGHTAGTGSLGLGLNKRWSTDPTLLPCSDCCLLACSLPLSIGGPLLYTMSPGWVIDLCGRVKILFPLPCTFSCGRFSDTSHVLFTSGVSWVNMFASIDS